MAKRGWLGTVTKEIWAEDGPIQVNFICCERCGEIIKLKRIGDKIDVVCPCWGDMTEEPEIELSKLFKTGQHVIIGQGIQKVIRVHGRGITSKRIGKAPERYVSTNMF